MIKFKYVTLLLCFCGVTFSMLTFGQDQKSTTITVKSPDELYLGAVMEQQSINSDSHHVLDIITDSIVVSFGGLNVKSKTIISGKTPLYRAIQEALQGKHSDNRRFSFDIKELGNYNDISLHFGQKIDLTNWFSIKETAAKPRTLLAINMEKIAFTVDMDMPAKGTFQINKALQDKYNLSDLIYINTLSFGRKAVIIVESGLDASIVKEALSAIFKGSKLSDKEIGILANCNYRGVLIGGSKTVINLEGAPSLQQVIDFIDTNIDASDYGKPVAFTASYLNNNQIFSNSY